jgi:uncharacterized membrane protein
LPDDRAAVIIRGMDAAGAVLAISILAGFATSAAALSGRYRELPSFLTGPRICKLEAGGCAILFRTKTAALLGVPNSLLGLVYYAALPVALAFGAPAGPLAAISLAPVAMTVYLARYLIREKLECRICWVGHAANAATAACLWVRFLVR